MNVIAVLRIHGSIHYQGKKPQRAGGQFRCFERSDFALDMGRGKRNVFVNQPNAVRPHRYCRLNRLRFRPK